MNHLYRSGTHLAKRLGLGQSTRRGITLSEMMLALTVLGILMAIAIPKFSRVTLHLRVNEAVNTVAADLGQAVSLAARRQKPMTLLLEGSTRYIVKDRATAPADTVRLRREIAIESDAGVRTVTFSPSTVTVYANGTVSSALTVSLASNGYTRQVTLSAAGQVRVVAAP